MSQPINKTAVAAVLSAAAVVAAVPAVWLARAEAGASAGGRPAQQDNTRGAAAAAARAQDPADPVPGARADRLRGPRAADTRPVSPAEWEEISDFMSGYMPWRIAEVERMPDGQWKERIKKLLSVRYRSLRQIQSRDPESYEQRLGQLKVEDQIYQLVSSLPGADDDRRRKIREELRTQVSALVDVDLSERKRRVDRLKEELARQEGLLEQDTQQRETLVEQRVNRFLHWGSRWPAQRGAAGKGGPAGSPNSRPAPGSDAGNAKQDPSKQDPPQQD